MLLRKDQVNATEDNKDVQLLKEEMWTRKITTVEITVIQKNQIVKETTLLEEIWKNRIKEQEVLKELEKDEGQTWEDDGIVYIEENINISDNQKIQEQILQENHDLAGMGYPEQQKMLKLIKRNYWWLGIKGDVRKHVQQCIKCQQNKVQHMKKAGELYPLRVLEGLW